LHNEFEGHLFHDNEVKRIFGLFHEEQEISQEIIAFKNWYFNMEKFQPLPATPEIFIKNQVPYNYNPQAQGGLMEKTLKQIMIDEDGDYKGDETKHRAILEFIGYLFTKGNPLSLIIFIHGNGANGKSLLLGLIKKIFEGTVSAVPLHNMGQQFGPQDLLGKKINLLYDLSRKPLTTQDVGNLKAITGGDDMTIPIKFGASVDANPQIKIIGMGNELPQINDESRGFWRRIVTIELKNSFEGRETPNLKEKLIKDGEGMEWLIYNSIEAYKEVVQTGKWTIQIGGKESKLDYLKRSNPCLYAAEEIYTKSLNRNDWISREDVVKDITDILQVEGLEIPISNHAYYQAIRAIGGTDKETSEGRRTVRGFGMIKRKTGEKTSLKLSTVIKKNGETEIKGEELNHIQADILNFLGIGSSPIGGIIEDLKTMYAIDEEDYLNEVQALLDSKILNIQE
jgi:putative DNA primase/helicase